MDRSIWAACIDDPNVWMKNLECHPGFAAYLQVLGVIVAIFGTALITYWSTKAALQPALQERQRRARVLVYGEIAERLTADLHLKVPVFSLHHGPVVGTLMYRILEIETDAPLLNLLVVNTPGRPGYGADTFLKERFRLPERGPITGDPDANAK
jgi:hypothetical protein